MTALNDQNQYIGTYSAYSVRDLDGHLLYWHDDENEVFSVAHPGEGEYFTRAVCMLVGELVDGVARDSNNEVIFKLA